MLVSDHDRKSGTGLVGDRAASEHEHFENHNPKHQSSCDHRHPHHGGHAHSPEELAKIDSKKLFLALCLTGGFMVAEIIGGILSGSLALIADAGHMASDTVALGIALFAVRAALMPPDQKRNFGYRRTQVLGAFVNALGLLAIATWVSIEALIRLFNPIEVLALPMLFVAVLGLFINIAAFRLLHGADHGNNLNIRGALWHVIGDMLGSAAAILAALIILLTGWVFADPLLSILVVAIIVRGALPILHESGHILLEGAPPNLQREQIITTLQASIDEIDTIDRVHIWSLDNTNPVITLSLQLRQGANASDVLRQSKALLEDRFGLTHTTIEINHPDAH